MNLITDRTEADVFNAKELAKKGYANMTAAEKTLWDAGMKGKYKASDMNRVGEACAELYDALTAAGYDPWYYGYAALRTNWTDDDEPTTADYQKYITTIISIKDTLGTVHAVPHTVNNLNFEGANNIEKMLLKVESELEGMVLMFPKSGMYESGNVLYIPDHQEVAPVLPVVVPPQTATVPTGGGVVEIPYSTYGDTWGSGWRGLMNKTLKVSINGEDWYLPPCYTNASWNDMDGHAQAWGEFYNSPLYTFYPVFVYATDMEVMKIATYLEGEVTYSIDEVEYDDRPNYRSVARNQIVFTNAVSPHTANLKFDWVDSYMGGWANTNDTLTVTVNNAFKYTLPPCPSPYTYGYDAWGACNNYVGGSEPPDFATCPICIYKDPEDNIIIETEYQETMTVLVEVQE